jgi:hypothetical protein
MYASMSGHQRLVRRGQRRLAGLAAETTGAVRLARTDTFVRGGPQCAEVGARGPFK